MMSKEAPSQEAAVKTPASEYGAVQLSQYGSGPSLANDYEVAPPLLPESHYDAVDSKLE
jgi:hypothetical protein